MVGLNAPVCLRVDAEEKADMVWWERGVSRSHFCVTEHVGHTPTPIAFGSDASALVSSDATTQCSRVPDTVRLDRN